MLASFGVIWETNKPMIAETGIEPVFPTIERGRVIRTIAVLPIGLYSILRMPRVGVEPTSLDLQSSAITGSADEAG